MPRKTLGLKGKESKKDRFVRIAEARTAKIISMVRLLGNCSNKSVYAYSENDLKKIFGAIEETVGEAKDKFKLHKSGTKEIFKLK